jgi:FlaA1/EpsC-like NDP-sugar epimerase
MSIEEAAQLILQAGAMTPIAGSSPIDNIRLAVYIYCK